MQPVSSKSVSHLKKWIYKDREAYHAGCAGGNSTPEICVADRSAFLTEEFILIALMTAKPTAFIFLSYFTNFLVL
jgi:hypothetical protein